MVPADGGLPPVLGQVVQGDLADGPCAPVHGDPGPDLRQPDRGEPAVRARDAFPLRRNVVQSCRFELLPDRILLGRVGLPYAQLPDSESFWLSNFAILASRHAPRRSRYAD